MVGCPARQIPDANTHAQTGRHENRRRGIEAMEREEASY